MKVNSKILSIPPYISSSWENISSLYIEDKEDKKILVINLKTGAKLEIPGLTTATLLQIFQSHEQYLEESDKNLLNTKEQAPSFSLGIPLTVNSDQFQELMEMMQDPTKLPQLDLPAHIIEKISETIKHLGVDEKWIESSGELLDHPMYEPLKQFLSQQKNDKTVEAEDEVSDEDLRFKEWDIHQMTKELYKVMNPLDHSEEYQVFLGNPIGCTCGHQNCDHIKAVLTT